MSKDKLQKQITKLAKIDVEIERQNEFVGLRLGVFAKT